MTKQITTVACKEANGITPTATHPVIKDSLTTILTADYADPTEQAGTHALEFFAETELSVCNNTLEPNVRESAGTSNSKNR